MRGRGTKVYNNIFIDTVGAAVYVGYNADTCLVAHNTIVGNLASTLLGSGAFTEMWAGIALDNAGGGSTNCQVRNNLIYQPGVTYPPPIANMGAGHVLSNNLCSSAVAGCASSR